MISTRVATQQAPLRPVSPFAGPTLRAAMALGFAITLGVWVWAGYRLTQRMTDVEAETTAINGRYMRAQEALATVRAQVLLASVLVRDALLDPNPSTDDSYLQRFETSYQTAERALGQYVPVLDTADERASISVLDREIQDFHVGMLDVFRADTRGPASAFALLQTRVMPKRELVLRVSDQVQSLNRAAFVQQRAQTTRLYRDAERRAWQRLGLALAASLAVGLLAVLYAGILERRVGRQRSRDLQLTSDLHRLSARLATAQEDERRRIARELHDEVGQALSAINMELAHAIRVSGGSLSGARLESARATAEETLRAIRNLSHLLHPAVLDDLGLSAALKQYLTGFGERHGIETDLVHEHMDARLAPEIETALYRIVQEALTNVAKHAHARICRIHLRGLETSVLVTIEDNGSGFDPAELGSFDRPTGLGLISIRERVSQLGGRFQLDTAIGQGTTLTIAMPARPSAGAAVPELLAADSIEHEAFLNGKAANFSG